jgi:murein L,D-transpeptidase YcbB/YkuD
LTTDQKVSGLNPDGVTKPARTVRVFYCEVRQECHEVAMNEMRLNLKLASKFRRISFKNEQSEYS